MAKPTKRTGGRTTKKIYNLVRFNLDGWEGEFEIPNTDNIPAGVAGSLAKGDIDAFFAWLETAGVDPTIVEDLKDMDMEEFGVFQEAWGKAGAIPVPKS